MGQGNDDDEPHQKPTTTTTTAANSNTKSLGFLLLHMQRTNCVFCAVVCTQRTAANSPTKQNNKKKKEKKDLPRCSSQVPGKQRNRCLQAPTPPPRRTKVGTWRKIGTLTRPLCANLPHHPGSPHTFRHHIAPPISSKQKKQRRTRTKG